MGKTEASVISVFQVSQSKAVQIMNFRPIVIKDLIMKLKIDYIYKKQYFLPILMEGFNKKKHLIS